MKVIKHIENYNPEIYNMGCKEKDFICTVVTDISTNYDQKKTATLYENLLMNLADCNADDSIVCINGRVTRVLNSYNDGENMNFRSKQVIKNEMLEVAAAARNEFIAALSEEDKAKYEKDDETITESLKLRVADRVQAVDGANDMKDTQKEILSAL